MDELQDIVSSEFLKPFFIEHISKYCDKCGVEYNQRDIGIISETNSSAIIQAQCHKCKSSYMAHIVKPLQMTKKVPIKLDISPRLIKSYFDIGPITADEILALRKKILKAQDVESLSYALGYEKREKKTKKTSSKKSKQS
jgi:hypothetical protein